MGTRIMDEFMDEVNRLRRVWSIQRGNGAKGLWGGEEERLKSDRVNMREWRGGKGGGSKIQVSSDHLQ